MTDFPMVTKYMTDYGEVEVTFWTRRMCSKFGMEWLTRYAKWKHEKEIYKL
jgi:hypothetical protein